MLFGEGVTYISGSCNVPATCVIGLQWGDEAKGKLVDILTSQFDIVVRYQGGANAGHTVVFGGNTYKLHLVPSGILNERAMNLITPGVVIHPQTILGEIERLAAAEATRCRRPPDAQPTRPRRFPWHIAEDKALENADEGESNDAAEAPSARQKIGTTLRGIGPCYRDKVGRTTAVRLGDLYRDDFAERVAAITERKKTLLGRFGRPGRRRPQRGGDHD